MHLLDLETKLAGEASNIGDYSGSLTGIGANVQYQAFKHVGIGSGYQYLNVDIEVDKNDWKGKADFTYHGPFSCYDGQFLIKTKAGLRTMNAMLFSKDHWQGSRFVVASV